MGEQEHGLLPGLTPRLNLRWLQLEIEARADPFVGTRHAAPADPLARSGVNDFHHAAWIGGPEEEPERAARGGVTLDVTVLHESASPPFVDNAAKTRSCGWSSDPVSDIGHFVLPFGRNISYLVA